MIAEVQTITTYPQAIVAVAAIAAVTYIVVTLLKRLL